MSDTTRTRQRVQPTNTKELHKLLDAAGLAEYLGVKEGYVRQLVQQRRIPFVQWGRYVRFDPTAVASWIESVTVQPQQPRQGWW